MKYKVSSDRGRGKSATIEGDKRTCAKIVGELIDRFAKWKGLLAKQRKDFAEKIPEKISHREFDKGESVTKKISNNEPHPFSVTRIVKVERLD